jgi:hypothetical protein
MQASAEESPMAQATCPKCDSTTFEMKEHSPRGSSYKLMFVQCSKWGAVIGFTDYYNLGAILHKMAAALKIKLT